MTRVADAQIEVLSVFSETVNTFCTQWNSQYNRSPVSASPTQVFCLTDHNTARSAEFRGSGGAIAASKSMVRRPKNYARLRR
jgi:hypothetical protein